MRTLLLIFFATAVLSTVVAQEYRIIVGGFAKEDNAKRFTNQLVRDYPGAQYMFNPDRNLYYVSVFSATDKEQALKLTADLQKGSFSDAWLYYCSSCSTVQSLNALVEVQPPQETIVEETKEEVQPDPTPVEIPTEVPVDAPVEETVEEQPPTETVMENVPEQAVVSEQPVEAFAPAEPLKPKGKYMIFTIVDHNGQEIPGEVHFVDRTTQEHHDTYPGNTKIDVLPPAKLRNQMPVLCALFGYKEQTHLINYDDPSKTPGAVQNEDGIWTFPYQLELLSKKDVSVMYKVSFYKDAVIMLPSSQSEMDQLVNLMKLNPDYEIKIHGHANGKHKRKIIALGDNNNFFSVEGSKTFTGNDKRLSELRAEAVQLYLTLNGIDKKRTKIYGWGNTIQLVNENSPSAKLNDRIEIEILGD